MEEWLLGTFEILNLSEVEEVIKKFDQMCLKENLQAGEYLTVTVSQIMDGLHAEFVQLHWGETICFDLRVPKLNYIGRLDFKKTEDQETDVLNVRCSFRGFD